MISRVSGSLTLFWQALCFVCFIVDTTVTVSASISISANETDQEALLAFKNQVLEDPFGILSSWNNSRHFCDWQGVQCGRRHQRVTVLNLTSLKLSGSLSPHVGNLTFLRVIDLSNNSFHGPIPQETGSLFRLQILYLNNNSFQGELPSNLSRNSDLRYLNLIVNSFTGKIPVQFGSLTKLERLFLSANYFTGTIPPSLGNISSLALLSLTRNNLEGSIPAEFGKLSNLLGFKVAFNNLSGTVPQLLFNRSSLVTLDFTGNQLQGYLPQDLGLTLPNLQNIYIDLNHFSGPIPTSIANASRLVQIDFSRNDFTGPIPESLGTLQNLQVINFGDNPLGDEKATDLSFLTSLTNCTNLRVLWFYQNNLKGSLPDSVANLSSNLVSLQLFGNYISGSIPPGIGNLVNLGDLFLSENTLTGSIPGSIGKLFNLQEFYAHSNKIYGEIPSSFGNITRISRLVLRDNLLEGRIPISLGNCSYLQGIDLSYNRLNGAIPEQVIGLSSLSLGLILASNNLTGPLPSIVGNLKNLNELDISNNKLSGEIPSTLENCQMLEVLNMSDNFFEGTIPSTFSTLRGIKVINLSHNNFSGQIPQFLSALPLTTLNLSFNDFDGEVPTGGVFWNVSEFSVLGNKKLCGGITRLQLPACPKMKQGSQLSGKMIAVVVTSVVLLIILSLVCLCAAIRIRSSKSEPYLASPSESNVQYPKLSYADLFHATDGFSSTNLIGEGRYGLVYKGILRSDEQTVAVKVLNLRQQGASKTFMVECEALRNIRHRNLVKIITSCSSIDFKGNDFKALVFEFLPNGSLDGWIHPSSNLDSLKNLNLVQRLNIAIDVASALDYLHNRCETPVAHCDLKPSNILLDNDLTARVGDFGLTKFLSTAVDKSIPAKSNSAIRGTIGYIAPEYAMFEEVSTLGDVYSYGILLMELFTGKRPTDSMFSDNFSLHNFVKAALPDRVTEIADPWLTFKDEGELQNSTGLKAKHNSELIEEALAHILCLGVACSAASTRERMKIWDVLVELDAIKRMLLSYVEEENEK